MIASHSAARCAGGYPSLKRFASATALVCLVLVCPGLGRAFAAGSKYETDLQAFFDEIDRTYPFFDLKGIRADWDGAKKGLAVRVRRCRSDADFVALVRDAMRCLRDGHIGFRELDIDLPPPPKEYRPDISFLPATRNRVVVMHAGRKLGPFLATGTVVTRIDGVDARRFLEERARKAWGKGGWFSSPQRARLFEYRIPLRGRKGERHRLTFLYRRRPKTALLVAETEVRGWPHTYNMPRGLKPVGRSFSYAKLPGGAGYMYLRRIDESVEEGMAEAVSACPGARGWIVDLRGNSGGGYDDTLIGLMKSLPRPVAAITDAGCISAGETVARDLVRLADARLFGSKTAGSSTSKRGWTFPSGIATLSLSVRSRFGPDRRPIEFNGIAPDVEVEACPEELHRGLNSAILRAEEYLREVAGK